MREAFFSACTTPLLRSRHPLLLCLQQELLELKQLYVKATGEAFGAPPSGGKGKTDGEKNKKTKKGGGDGQPKQMDTRKADKAKKVCRRVFVPPCASLNPFSTAL